MVYNTTKSNRNISQTFWLGYLETVYEFTITMRNLFVIIWGFEKKDSMQILCLMCMQGTWTKEKIKSKSRSGIPWSMRWLWYEIHQIGSSIEFHQKEKQITKRNQWSRHRGQWNHESD